MIFGRCQIIRKFFSVNNCFAGGSFVVLFWVLLVELLGGFAAGVTSFGTNLIAIPLLTLVIDFKDAVVIALLALLPLLFILCWLYRANIIWTEMAALGLPSLAGAVFGVWGMVIARPFPLLVGAALGILFMLAWQICNGFLKRKPKPVSMRWSVPFGFAAGFLTGAIGMGGPPMIIYIYLRGWNKRETIGGGAFCCLIQMMAVVPAQLGGGLISPDILWLSLWAGVAGAVGVFLGLPVVKKINEKLFRNILLLILAFSVVTLLTKAFMLV